MKHEEYIEKQSLLHCQTCKKPLALLTKSCTGCGDVDPFSFKKLRKFKFIKVTSAMVGGFSAVVLLMVFAKLPFPELLIFAAVSIALLINAYIYDDKIDALRSSLMSRYDVTYAGLDMLLEETSNVIGL